MYSLKIENLSDMCYNKCVKNDRNFYGYVIDEDKFKAALGYDEYEKAMISFKEVIGINSKNRMKIIWDFDMGFMLVGYELPIPDDAEKIDHDAWLAVAKFFPIYEKRFYSLDKEYTVERVADCCDMRWLDTGTPEGLPH